MIVATTNEYGVPQCPICHTYVELEGQFCSPTCWEEFHVIIHDMGEPIEMTYLDLYQQPWYGVAHG